jgi:tetratricopeptide (TPR) repeat protein
MRGFAEYAPYLQHPLTLIGFVLLLIFGTQRALLSSGIIAPVTGRSGSKIVQLLLRYGFIIALVTIVLGFGLAFFQTSRKGMTPEDVSKVTTTLTNYFVRSKQQADLVDLNSVSDQERAATASSIREIEELLSKTGMKLTPELWTGLGYSYLVANEIDKSKAALLEAIRGNPSLVEANYLLASVNQLEASEFLLKGDLGRTRELLKAAEEYAKVARLGQEENTGIGIQLGNIYKQLAQADLARNNVAGEKDELEKAKALFQMGLGVHHDDASAHNGLGVVYYLQGDLDKAIEEQQEAVRLLPPYTFAWHDLALALVDKYQQETPPNKTTLAQLNAAIDKVFELQQTDRAQKLPPEHLQQMEKTRALARAEAATLPRSATSKVQFKVSGVGSPGQTGSIQDSIAGYDRYLRSVGFSIPGGAVQIQITPANDTYVSYYDPSAETIYVNVRNADSTFWPLRDYTIRALSASLHTQLPPSLVAILSGLATYYPSSATNDPNYGPGYGGHLDKFRSLDDLHLENASADGSSIWGSICWELRTLLDQHAADALLLKAWGQMLSPGPESSDAQRFASSVIELHKSSGGSKEEVIRRLFQRRGLKL